MRRAVVAVWVVVWALAWEGVRVAGQVSPVAPELAVNSYTEAAQRTPVICRGSAGEVVIWQSDKQDGRGWGIYGQRYGTSGAAVGTEFRVHSHTTGNESHPAVACTDDGRFIVVWDSDHPDTVRGVFAQLFDAQGATIGTELQINADIVSDSVLPAVCSAPDGTSIVAWQGYHASNRQDIFAQRLSSTGEPLAKEFRVNTHTESTQSRPAVGCHDTGGFVVVWDSDVQDGADFGIFAQRYDHDGTPLGFEFQVNSTTRGSQHHPRVATAGANDFVVVWESRSETLGSYGIFGQRFGDGGARGTEFRIGNGTRADLSRPVVATDARGDFVVVWASEHNGGQLSGQRYTSGGVAVGPEFPVAGATEATARFPSVAAAARGDFTVAWQRRDSASGDDGIAAQRFLVCGNGSLDPGEDCDDGNLRAGDCCSPSCAFEQATGFPSEERLCRDVGADALVCVADETTTLAPCNDNDACTTNDACHFGVCVGGARIDCDDGNLCTTDTCRPQVGCLNAPNTLPCDDGNVCTGPDACRAGTCRGGAALSCDDLNVCTDDSCDPVAGCVHPANAAACSDGDACTADDRCVDGTCRSGTATRCDDGNSCTDDTCEPLAGCRNTANAAACDDGNPCTSGDTCLDAVCVSGPPTSCDDANPCTEDHCAVDSGCINTPINVSCDDGNACTRTDQCEGGRCRGLDPIVCTAIDQCHATGTCEPTTGLCSSPSLPDGSACDDGAACTVGDRCVDGQCAAGRTGVPFLVKDVRTGPKSSAPVELVAAGSRVFFRSDDGSHGRELWASDGTPAGTTLVLDIRPGTEGSAPGALVALRDRVFFAATDAQGDRELWSSDGTASGTRAVRNIRGDGGADPTLLVAVGDLVFFVADDGASGRELWRSDGTEQGTAMVMDVRPGHCGPGACDAAIADLTTVDGKLFFTANDGINGRELWSSDGSASGTTMVADIRPGADGSQPAFLTAYNGALLFAADDGEHGKELWQSRGSATSTAMIADIRAGQCDNRPCSSSPSCLTSTEGTLFFTVARTGLAPGASSGDAPLVASAPTNAALPPLPSGELKGDSAELWRSDGTGAGTNPVALLPGLPYVRRALHSNLVFSVGSGAQTALWRSDGTSGGTRSLASAGATSPAWPVSLDGRLFFTASDPQRGTELWSSDGTEAGTVFVYDINPHPASPFGGSSSPASLTANGDMLLFSADDGDHGRELWALCR